MFVWRADQVVELLSGQHHGDGDEARCVHNADSWCCHRLVASQGIREVSRSIITSVISHAVPRPHLQETVETQRTTHHHCCVIFVFAHHCAYFQHLLSVHMLLIGGRMPVEATGLTQTRLSKDNVMLVVHVVDRYVLTKQTSIPFGSLMNGFSTQIRSEQTQYQCQTMRPLSE